MASSLAGQVAIITGGSKGYGTGIAEALKAAGADVWITARDEAVLRATAERLGVKWVRADVCRGADWDRVFEQAVGADGRLDILVNNAGAGVSIAPTDRQTDADIEQSIAVNLTGAMLGCRRAATVMKRRQSGTIINVSSVCSRQAWPGFAIYSAAKAGLDQFSKCLYTELRASGVRVTSLIPSWGATEFGAAAKLPARSAEDNARCIQPRELGDLVVTICSLPPHLEIQDLTVWPLIQEVIPL